MEKWLEKGKDKITIAGPWDDENDESQLNQQQNVIADKDKERPPEMGTETAKAEGIFGYIEGEEERRDIYQPLCFSREIFNRADFDASAFISDCRSRVPVESLLNDLTEYSASLERFVFAIHPTKNFLIFPRRELLYIINRDYSTFVSLSTSLAGLDKVIATLRGPISEMEVRVQRILQVIEAYMAELKEKLKQKAQVAERRRILELFADIHRSVEKIEILLNIDSHSASHSGEELTLLRRADKEERIADILMKSDEETCNLIQVLTTSPLSLPQY